MEENIKEKIEKTLQKSEEALGDSKNLFNSQRYTGTVIRAYYAMFHASCALLLTKNLEFSSHGEVISGIRGLEIKLK